MRSLAAALALLLLSASVFAQSTAPDVTHQRSRAVRPGSAGRTTINNDSSCDIGVFPAATLLLPYFAVDVTDQRTENTIFSITNVSPLPQIARVTIWSDWAFPVLTFNIFLTGYDVQPVNLYDVVARGMIPATSTASPNARNGRGEPTNPTQGSQPATNLGNPNFLPSVVSQCAAGALPSTLPPSIVTDVVKVLTIGTSTGAAISCPIGDGKQAQVGSNHGSAVAVGYATIDVVATCSPTAPTDLKYFTQELLFDNVLTGDYQDIQTHPVTGNRALGNPMVHIRAVPEGGGTGSVPNGVTPLPFTFYDRLTMGASDRRIDRRQPLPSAFSARWISGINAPFDTAYKFWRESVNGANPGCGDYYVNDAIGAVEFIRFDERENASVAGGGVIYPIPFAPPTTRATDLASVNTFQFPSVITTDTGGWMYMNLSNQGAVYGSPAHAPYSTARTGYGAPSGQRDVSQNWVVVSLIGQGPNGADLNATALGNGCTPAPLPAGNVPAGSAAPPSDYRLAPSGGVVVCPPGTKPTNGDATACRGRNVNP